MKFGTKAILSIVFIGLVTFPLLTVSRDEVKFPIDPKKTLGNEKYEAALKVIEGYKNRFSSSTELCQGRLTLTSGTPVTSSDVTAATTIYFAPYHGNQISVFDGATWTLLSFTEISVAVPSTTTTPFDIFAYNNGGTLALETTDWTSDTARAVSLVTENGVYLNASDKTRRLVGSSRTTSVSGQTEDSAKRRFLWNYCNRVPRNLLAVEPTDSWSYATATLRPANGNTTVGETRVEYMIGLRAEIIKLRVYVPSTLGDGSGLSLGIGLNSTTVNSAILYGGHADTANYLNIQAIYHGVPTLGYTYAQWIEMNDSSMTWYSSLSDADDERAGGLMGTVWQ